MSDARKRDLIWHLSHKTLRKIATSHELSVRANASLESLQAMMLMESDIELREMLPYLARPELKLACEQAGLSDSGRKDELRTRLESQLAARVGRTARVLARPQHR